MLAELSGLRRSVKRILMLSADCAVIPFAFWAVAVLKNGRFFVPGQRLVLFYVLATAVALPIFYWFGLYRVVVRFVSPRVVIGVIGGVLASAITVFLADLGTGTRTVSISVLAAYCVFAVSLIAGSRWLVAMLLNSSMMNGARDAVVIYGAGNAGLMLADALRSSREFRLFAFVDDDPTLQGAVMKGLRVYAPSRLSELVRQYDVRRVLMAMPGESHRRRREVLARLEPLGVHVQTVPRVAEVVSGRARIEEVREIDVRDLLGREAVPANNRLLDACIRGKCVMVTGAGGSIGAELCRQILPHDPVKLVLVEMSEAALYTIERELRAYVDEVKPGVKLVPLLGNAHSKHRIREIMQTYRVHTVYHAAAYKHVPLVEHNMIEGIHNNVVATWHTAEAAMEAGVETFVLVSTDKAVNPANVMGATKRLAELVLQALHLRGSKTRFCMVRFGNVLASSGSVVPLFHQQIRGGGPITVTHPDVVRYFMTIEEAAMLVIQAGSMATGGDLFVLDMGKPVKIVDLARRMLTLMGLTVRDHEHPAGDIEIVFTGLRPAEKLYEELLIGTDVSGTEHPRILRAVEEARSWEQVERWLRELAATVQSADCSRARELLMEAVQEYNPKEPIQDLVWMKRNGLVASKSDKFKVTDLNAVRGRL